jgi:hypothetical protein
MKLYKRLLIQLTCVMSLGLVLPSFADDAAKQTAPSANTAIAPAS